MYNGIGLTTPRGSGTNGYVQRNLAFITTCKEKVNPKIDDDIKPLEGVPFKEPNKDILLHEKKRQVEVKCYELQQLMEDQGYTEAEIDEKVSSLRGDLLLRLTDEVPSKHVQGSFKTQKSLVSDASRLVPRGTHETAALAILKNNVFKDALGISEDYEDGSSLRRVSERRQQAEESKALFESQKLLKTIRSSDSEVESSDGGNRKRKKKSKSSKKSHKKHKKSKDASASTDSSSESDSDSQPPDTKRKKHKDHKKHKHHRHGHKREKD